MKRSRIATIVTILAVWTSCAHAEDDRRPTAEQAALISALTTKARHDAQAAIDRGLAFLKATQRADGGWESMDRSDPAITSMVGKCFIQHKNYGPNHPLVQKALALVLTFRHDDGGIYTEGLGLRNYYTSICLMALAAANNKEYQPHITQLPSLFCSEISLRHRSSRQECLAPLPSVITGSPQARKARAKT